MRFDIAEPLAHPKVLAAKSIHDRLLRCYFIASVRLLSNHLLITDRDVVEGLVRYAYFYRTFVDDVFVCVVVAARLLVFRIIYVFYDYIISVDIL